MSDTPNYRLIEVAFLGPTNTMQGLQSLNLPQRSSAQDKVVMSYDYAIGDP